MREIIVWLRSLLGWGMKPRVRQAAVKPKTSGSSRRLRTVGLRVVGASTARKRLIEAKIAEAEELNGERKRAQIISLLSFKHRRKAA